MGWMSSAACAGMSWSTFFDASTSGVALAACRECSVVDECLAFAVENDMDDGVYGGLTAQQRRTLKWARAGSGRGLRLVPTWPDRDPDPPA